MRYGYARVSKDDQDLDAQVYMLERAGIEAHCIEREHISGRELYKPKLELILNELTEGDELHAVDITRLGRVVKELIRIGEVIQERGASLYLRGVRIKFESADDNFMYQVSAASSEWERRRISERTANSLAWRRAEGKPVGRPRATNPAQEEVIRRMLDQDFSYRQISSATGLSLGTIARIKQEAADTQAVRDDPSIMRDARKVLASRQKTLEKAAKDFARAATKPDEETS